MPVFAGALAQGCGRDCSMSDAHRVIVRQLSFFSPQSFFSSNL